MRGLAVTNRKLHQQMVELGRSFESRTGYVYPTRFVATKTDYERGIVYLERAIELKASNPDIAEKLCECALWGNLLPSSVAQEAGLPE